MMLPLYTNFYVAMITLLTLYNHMREIISTWKFYRPHFPWYRYKVVQHWTNYTRIIVQHMYKNSCLTIITLFSVASIKREFAVAQTIFWTHFSFCKPHRNVLNVNTLMCSNDYIQKLLLSRRYLLLHKYFLCWQYIFHSIIPTYLQWKMVWSVHLSFII